MVERLPRFLQVRRSRDGDGIESSVEIRGITRRAMPGSGAVPATGTATTVDEGVGVTRASPDTWAFPAARAVIHARRVSGGAAGFDRSGDVAHVSSRRPGRLPQGQIGRRRVREAGRK